MSSDGGDGDEQIYGFLPGSIEPYVSHEDKIILLFLPMMKKKIQIYNRENDESTSRKTPIHTHLSQTHTHTYSSTHTFTWIQWDEFIAEIKNKPHLLIKPIKNNEQFGYNEKIIENQRKKILIFIKTKIKSVWIDVKLDGYQNICTNIDPCHIDCI